MNSTLEKINKDLIQRYEASCPYYTSYPTLSEWSPDFTAQDYLNGLDELCRDSAATPLLLYIHFPFCAQQCYYCICNSVITHDRTRIREFMDYLFREIDLLFSYFEQRSLEPRVRAIHIGGGSPNYMETEEFELLIRKIESFVDIRSLDDFTVEIDARTVNHDKLICYYKNGVNRLSFGIQDFEAGVQRAVNRVQPPELIEGLLSPAIRSHFKSINFDLLYGLPLQTRETFRNTIATVSKFAPDRITLLRYAHVPDRKPHQKLIKESDIPAISEKTVIFTEAVHHLMDLGYEHIGIDHFARPTDSLARALYDKTLWRHFNGFDAGGDHHIIGIGPTSTSSLGSCYAQNGYSLPEYYKSIDRNEFPVSRGYKLSQDDVIRRDVINRVLCYSLLNFAEIEHQYGIRFNEYFGQEIETLKDLAEDGIIEFSPYDMTVTPLGRIFIRQVCRAFDVYLQGEKVYKVSGP